MEHISLKKLVLSARNVRTNVEDATDIADLVASIEAHGLLNPLVVAASSNKRYEVVAGGRRYRALCQLAEGGKLADDFTVPVQIIDPAKAEEVSLVENFVRKDMRDYEIYRAFKLVQDQTPGITVAELAKRFGMRTDRAERILRLGNLHPEIFEAYILGNISSDQAKAFAATADHDRQLEAWQAFNNLANYDRGAWKIRQLLGIGDRSTLHDLNLIGQAAYEAAGGVVERDLFSENVRISDPELLERLVNEHHTNELRRIASLATNEVQLFDSHTVMVPWNAELTLERGEISAELQAKVDELQAKMEECADDDDYVELEAQLNAILDQRWFIIPEGVNVGLTRKYGRALFFDIDMLNPETVEPANDEEAEPTEDEEPKPEAIDVSRRALDCMAGMRRERLVERTCADMAVYSDATALLTFMVARGCFMGPRNYEDRGFSTVEPSPFHQEDWMQEPDHGKAWQLFRASKDHVAIARDMIGRFTQARHAFENSPFMDWIASLSAPQPWLSTPAFWELFNKKQIFLMLDEVIPSFRKIYSNAKLTDVRTKAHEICIGAIDTKISPMDADELAQASTWVPDWLRFEDERVAA